MDIVAHLFHVSGQEAWELTIKPHIIAAAIILLGLGNLPANAADGAQLAQACSSCHGLQGSGGEAIPPIAGIAEEELLARLMELSQPTVDATIMPRLLRGYSEDELAALAAYFAGVEQ